MTRTLFLAIMLPLIGGTAALAQAPPAGQAPPASQAPPGAFGANQPPPCVQEFLKLRSAAETRGKAIQAASKRKASAKEVCGLLTSFVAAEAKMVKYAETNNVWCGIPLPALEQMKNAHIGAQKARSNVCKVAAQGPPRPAGPTLGEALGTTPVPSASNVKKGSGTFDTLTGSSLGR